MSKITGTDHSERFALRVVSGMVVDGSLIVSWATGDPATSRMDWGFDSGVENQTPPVLLGPADRGYNPQKDTPKLVRYHRLAFPQTYVDTEHFFRVFSTNRRGDTETSRVYSVFVTDRAWLASEVGDVSVEIKPVSVDGKEGATVGGFESNDNMGNKPRGDSEFSIQQDNSSVTVDTEQSDSQATTLETNVTLTIE